MQIAIKWIDGVPFVPLAVAADMAVTAANETWRVIRAEDAKREQDKKSQLARDLERAVREQASPFDYGVVGIVGGGACLGQNNAGLQQRQEPVVLGHPLGLGSHEEDFRGLSR